jgi:hypothetical protein
LVTFNADGQARHIAAHYRPLSSLMFFSPLLRERFAGTPYAEHFLAGEGLNDVTATAPPPAGTFDTGIPRWSTCWRTTGES